jgi:hypothetical protein
VLGIFAFLALSWGLLLPIHEGPDEQNHYRYMIFLKDKGRLPIQLPLPPEVAGEGHQPPLYYALGALALRRFLPSQAWVELPNNGHFQFNENPSWFAHDPREEGYLRFSGNAVGPHLLRALQLWMPLLSLSCLWLLLCALPISQSLRHLSLALMALNPGFVFLSGVLNNDHLVLLFFSLTCLLIFDSAQQRTWSWGHSLGAGIFLGLGALSKISIFCLLPLALAYALVYGKSLKALASLALFGAICGFFYWRNLSLYGDPFGWTMHSLSCADTVHVKSVWDMGWAWFWLKRSFESFWIVFGWMSWRAPRILILPFLGLSLAALLGLRSKKLPRGSLALGLALAGLTLGVIKFNWNFDPPEGRYFYPALLPIAAFLAMGLDRWKLFHLPLAAWTALAGLALLNAWLVFDRLISLYYNV